MVLVIIVVVAWIIILVPSVMKRRSRTGSEIGSISHFHQQLRVLEQSAPQPIVAPAYRLRAVDGSGDPTIVHPDSHQAPVLNVVGADQLPRPALAFLGDDRHDAVDPDETAEPSFSPVLGDGLDRRRYPPDGGDTSFPAQRVADPLGRHLVRRRRRDTLGVLVGVFAVSLLIGLVPGASVAWLVTALSGLALAGYVSLLVHLRRTAEERDQKLHYLPRAGDHDTTRRGPAAVGGRYAHPSSQAVAAR